MSEVPGVSDRDHRRWRRRLRWTLAATFCTVLAVAAALGSVFRQGQVDSLRAGAQQEASVAAQRISLRLHESAGAAYMLGSLVQRSKGKLDDFETTAASIMELFPMAASLQLAPNAVVERIYPLPGNEAAIGHDILNSDVRRHEAHQAIARRQLVLGGPYKLLQGGMGVIGRYPVFIPDENGWGKFWGFATVIIRVPLVLEAARVNDLAEAGYRFEICRVLEAGGCEVFSRRGEGPPVDPVEVDIEVPNGRWLLRIAPEAGWSPPSSLITMGLASLLLAALITLAQYFLVKQSNR